MEQSKKKESAVMAVAKGDSDVEVEWSAWIWDFMFAGRVNVWCRAWEFLCGLSCLFLSFVLCWDPVYLGLLDVML